MPFSLLMPVLLLSPALLLGLVLFVTAVFIASSGFISKLLYYEDLSKYTRQVRDFITILWWQIMHTMYSYCVAILYSYIVMQCIKMEAMDILFVLVPCDLKLTRWFKSYSQSEAVFPIFQKCTYFAASEVVIFGKFFSNCWDTKTNRDKDMKPTANDHKFPKFL